MNGSNEIDNESWELLQEWVSSAKNEVKVLPVDPEAGERVLRGLGVTTRSLLGTVAYRTGGIVFDHGWLRLLGGGRPQLARDLSTWNRIDKSIDNQRLPGALLIGDDVVGGFFALNGGAFESNVGNVFYLAPDTLEWEGMDMSYSDFLNWCCLGDIGKFYGPFKWHGWTEEVKRVDCDHGVMIYPFLWAKGGPLEARSKKVVPVEELWNLTLDMQRQLAKK